MRRSLTQLLGILALASVMIMPGCGGGGSDSAKPDNTVTTLDVKPTTLSLDLGQVFQLTAAPKNKGGDLVVATTTYASSNPAVVSVTTSGNVCAGTWDANNVVCTPGTTPGTANITATSGSVSQVIPVATHFRIASVTVQTTGVPCTSQTKTQQFTAKAFAANGTDITSTVGTPTWLSGDLNLATVDSTGLATAKKPGVTSVTALINNVISIPVTMTICGPASITIKEKDSNPAVTDFTLDTAATKTLQADVIDTLGNPITDISLTFSSSQPSVARVGTGNVITAASAGKTGIVASCTMPSCNPGATTPVYSNLVTVSVNGTSATNIYATGATATTIVPIDSATNTAGTAINIPTVTVSGATVNPVVNSFVFNHDGTQGYLGTDQGLVILIASTNTISINTGAPGKVLAISPDSLRVVVASASAVYVYDVAGSMIATLPISGATAASWSPDSLKTYIAAGTTVYDYSPALGLRNFTVSSAVNDVTFLTQGNYTYLAGDVGSTISSRATCNNAALTSLATATKPLVMESTFDSTHVYGTDGGNLYDVSVTTGTAPCPPPPPVHSLNTTAYGTTVTPRQLILLPNGSKTYLTNPTPQLLVYGPASGISTITLAGGATGSTTGGVTLDGKSLYVGATGTNDVQKIDTATNAVSQIPVNLKDKNSAAIAPDFVVVRTK